MIRFHGPNYDISNLDDFFTVTSSNDDDNKDITNEQFCDVSEASACFTVIALVLKY